MDNPFAQLTRPEEPVFHLPVHYSELDVGERRTVRNMYISKQKGLCTYCEQSLNGPPDPKIQQKWIDKKLFPANFFDHPIHLHHSHNTDLTIGAVHARCNAVLWQYENQ